MDKTVVARGFVRNLNILVRLLGLYGLGHKQVLSQLDTTWNDLTKIFAEDKKLQIAVAGEQLFVYGAALKAGSAERSMAQRFNEAGIARVGILAEVSRDEFCEMVRILAVVKPAEMLPELLRKFPAGGRIRIAGLQLSDDDDVAPAAQSSGGLGMANHLAAAVFGSTMAGSQQFVDDPIRLIQALCAAQNETPGLATVQGLLRMERIDPGRGGHEPSRAQSATSSTQPAAGEAGPGGHPTAMSTSTGAAAPPSGPMDEEEAISVIRWLARLGDTHAPKERSASDSQPEFSSNAQEVLREAIRASALVADQNMPQPLLVSLAEHLAIRVALEKYERGEMAFNAVQQTLNRLKNEIAALRKLVNTGELAAGSATASKSADAFDEELDRQFWSAVPARNKKQVLLSDDAWCVPPRNIRSFVEELNGQNDNDTAARILQNYLHLLTRPEPEARAKVAAGIPELANAWATNGLLEDAIENTCTSLEEKADLPEIQTALQNALLPLVKLAQDGHSHGAVNRSLLHLDRHDRQGQPTEWCRNLRAQIQVEDRVAEMVAEATRADHPQIQEILKKMPQAAVRQIAVQLGQCSVREECDRLRLLAAELGPEAQVRLRAALHGGTNAEAIDAAGLLASLDMSVLADELPQRLPNWSSWEQAAAVRHIAGSDSPGRGALLLRLLDHLHPFVVPQALDEVGFSGCTDVGALLAIAGGGGVGLKAPYVQVKAIEALGRLRAKVAIPDLVDLIGSRATWNWRCPRELRIATLQALLRIDPNVGASLMAKSGIGEAELRLAPLERNGQTWVRPRRYPRVTIRGGIMASVNSSEESFEVTLDNLSLGGGKGSVVARTVPACEADLEMRVGLRRLRMQALLHQRKAYEVVFEIASIDLQDRFRLREFLAARAV
ncbi:MAG: hypothetical protein ABSD20_02670 [Terriglobales bacterium]|jgi:hypothetical protein